MKTIEKTNENPTKTIEKTIDKMKTIEQTNEHPMKTIDKPLEILLLPSTAGFVESAPAQGPHTFLDMMRWEEKKAGAFAAVGMDGFHGIFMFFFFFSYGFHWFFIGFSLVFLWFSLVYLWFSLDFHWFFYGFHWFFYGFHWFIYGFHWIFIGFSMVFIGLSMVLLLFLLQKALQVPMLESAVGPMSRHTAVGKGKYGGVQRGMGLVW